MVVFKQGLLPRPSFISTRVFFYKTCSTTIESKIPFCVVISYCYSIRVIPCTIMLTLPSSQIWNQAKGELGRIGGCPELHGDNTSIPSLCPLIIYSMKSQSTTGLIDIISIILIATSMIINQ